MNLSNELHKISVKIPWDLLRDFDEDIKNHGYANRSEAIREAMRTFLQQLRKRK